MGGVGDNFAGMLEITSINEYDTNGNLLKTEKAGQIDQSVVEYEYNPLNQLVKFTDSEGNFTDYAYYPDGMRKSKSDGNNTVNFYYDRGYISTESTNGVISAQNYIGIQGIFARQDTNGTSFMLKNGHGDVVNLVQNGVITQTYDYDAYGLQAASTLSPADTNPFRYCGEYTDFESGNIYLRARYYNPGIGRFISEDPIKDGLNWYVYCGGNPVNFIDPSGVG